MAKIDTRLGIVKGHVTRIDPAAADGTVGVDVTLDEALPAGARPDQSVDGVIELQRLENVLFVESPAFGQENRPFSCSRSSRTAKRCAPPSNSADVRCSSSRSSKA